MTSPAWISLGSNLGDRRSILIEAVDRLARTPGVAVGAVSTHRETQPVGGPPGQGPFINAAARLDTTLSPRDLLPALQAIERDLGRVRAARWGERTVDLDLLLFEDRIVDEPDLAVPHPRLSARRFVLEPLAEIAPEVVDPLTRRTSADLLANLDRAPRLLLVDAPLVERLPGLLGRLAEMLPVGRLGDDSGSSGTKVLSGWLLGSTGRVGGQGALVDVEPTLIAVEGVGRPGRSPGPSSTPTYRLESADEDAVLAELVATCRGIAAG